MSECELEPAYWTCIAWSGARDSAGEHIDEAAMAVCARSSKLQVRRFAEDFGRLHEWTKSQLAQGTCVH